MPTCLAFNPGSASLKFDLIDLDTGQRHAAIARKRRSASIEEIGDNSQLLVFRGREIASKERCDVHSLAEGARFALDWVRSPDDSANVGGTAIDFVAIRVVHGGEKLRSATLATEEVCREVKRLEELAPLHNRSSLEILAAVQQQMPGMACFFAFDTAFHQTLPEVAWRYPLQRELADRYGVRKFGFHGLSHRYMLEQYAELVGKPRDEISVVSLHLESGCSATAIRKGRSVDNTMGLTPLEGLMMGTRCGSIDPAIIPYLVEKEKTSVHRVMELLNKQSGLLGIAGGTLDTRILVKRDDPAAKLALAMFAYRVRLAVGAYLALLGDAEAVLFGGGIGEDSPWLRSDVCAGLAGWGLDFDTAANDRSLSGLGQLHCPGSRLKAYSMPVEEGLQIAHECLQAFGKQGSASSGSQQAT